MLTWREAVIPQYHNSKLFKISHIKYFQVIIIQISISNQKVLGCKTLFVKPFL